MSNVVEFLEALSLDARRLTDAVYADAVAETGFDAAVREALVSRDTATLNRLVGARANVMALIFPAENEPSEAPDTEVPDGEPKEDDHDSHNDARAA